MDQDLNKKESNRMADPQFKIGWTFIFLLIALLLIGVFCLNSARSGKYCFSSFDEASYDEYKKELAKKEAIDAYWEIPEIYLIDNESKKELVRYGKELIAHTSRYLGPKGSVAQISNGLNCQNCHLNAGTKIWGNNYAGVASTYPKMRARSGKIETIEKRVNDCIQRSLNGKPLKNSSKEMKAIVSYMKFLGQNVSKESVPEGTGIYKIPYLKRPADPIKGEKIYSEKCSSCHGKSGEGMIAQDQIEYTYPPLWGDHSYNSGAGLFRLSRLAGYVRYNMPFGADFLGPQLSVADSWDVAAYINSQPRPGMDISKDWPDISKKPSDHPFGPFSDQFSEFQHKYGPFEEIDKAHKKK